MRLWTLTACLGLSTKAQSPAKPGADAHSIDLSCRDVGGLPQPVVEATIGGVRACLMVDTGTSDAVLDRALLLDGKDPTSGSGSEAAGQSFSYQALQRVPIAIGGLRDTLPQVAYTDLDRALLEAHVQGLLSPQRLTASRALLMCPGIHSLLMFADTASMKRWIKHSEPRLTLSRVPVQMRRNVPWVRVHTVGRGSVWMILDTGAKSTVLPAGYFGEEQEASSNVSQTGIGGSAHIYTAVPEQMVFHRPCRFRALACVFARIRSAYNPESACGNGCPE